MLQCRALRLLTSILLTLLLASPFLFGQQITGDVSGDVTDTTGAVLPNAEVLAQNLATGVSRSATTNNAGNYRIPELAIGNYKITATAQGFKTLVQNVVVQAGGVIRA